MDDCRGTVRKKTEENSFGRRSFFYKSNSLREGKEWYGIDMNKKKITYSIVLMVFLSTIFLLFYYFFNRTEAINLTGTTFNGTSTYVKIPNHSSYQTGTGDFTIELWFKADNVPTDVTDYRQLFSNRSAGGVEIQLYKQKIEANIRDTSGQISGQVSTTIITPGNWYHVAVVKRNGELELYLNGILEGRNTRVLQNTNSTSDLYIGSDVTTQENFNGMITDVRYWNIARTSSDINTNQTTDYTGNETNLVGLWKFDNITTDVTYDYTATKNNAKGYGFPSLSTALSTTNQTSSSVALGWSSITDATSYEVMQHTTTLYSGTAQTFTQMGLQPKTFYPYQIIAKSKNGKSLPSPIKTFATSPNGYATLDGFNDYFLLKNTPAFNVNTLNFSYSMWVKLDRYPTAGESGFELLSKRIMGYGNYEMQIMPTGYVKVFLSGGGESSELTSATLIPLGEWVHLAFVRNGSNNILYMNGNESASKLVAYNPDSSGDLTIGRDGGNTFEYLKGYLSDIRFWTIAKSASDIQQEMSVNPTGSETGLLAWWNPDGVTTTKVYDRTNHGYDLTGQNFASPLGTKINAYEQEVRFTWNTLTGIGKYQLWRDGVKIYEGVNTSYNDTGLTRNTTYVYELVALNANGETKETFQVQTIIEPTSSLGFDGVDDYIHVTHQPAYNFGLNDFSYEFWFKIKTLTQAQLISKRSGGGIEAQILSDYKLTVHFQDGTTDVQLKTQQVLNTDRWYHAAVTRHNGQAYLYLNGTLQQTITANLNVTTANHLNIGRDIGNGREYFPGNIAEVRFWNTYRTQEDIQENMNVTLTGNEPNLIGYWKLDNVTRDVVYDRSSLKNNGKSMNFSAFPSNIAVEQQTPTELNLNWSRIPDAKGYILKQNSGASIDVSATTYKATGLTEKTAYTYNWYAYSDSGYSKTETIKTMTRPSGFISLTGKEYFKASNAPVNTAPSGKNTVEFWMKWNGKDKSIPIGWNDYGLIISNGSFGFTTNNGDVLGIDFTPYLNQWVHVAAVFTNGIPSASTVKIYLNGTQQVLLQKEGTTDTAKTATYTFYLGRLGANQTDFFGGDLADVRIWNTERTAQEIQTNGSALLTGNEAGLIGYWTPDNVTTGMIYDKTNNKNHAQGYYFQLKTNFHTNDEAPTYVRFEWDKIPNATTYTLNRNDVLLYAGKDLMYKDDTVTPSSRQAYTLKVSNSNGESKPEGITPYRLNFDGVDDYIRINDIGTFSQFTIGFWVNPSYTWDDLPTNPYRTVLETAIGSVFLVERDGSGTFRLPGLDMSYYPTEGKIIPFHKWTYVTLVYTGNEKLIYVNGVEKARRSAPTGVVDLSTLYVGRYGSGTSNPWRNFKGSLDELSIWNVAKTQTGIQQDYTNTLSGNEPGLVGLWKFDSVTTEKAFDQSGKNHQAVASGFSPPTIDFKNTLPEKNKISVEWLPFKNAETYSLTNNVTGWTASGAAIKQIESGLTSNTSYTYNLILQNQNGVSLPVTKNFRTTAEQSEGLLFDGVNDYFNIIKQPYLAFTDQVTIEMDVNPFTYGKDKSNVPGNDNSSNLFSQLQTNTGHTGPFWLEYRNDGSLQAWFRNEGNVSLIAKTKLPLNTWNHITATYNSETGEAKIYLNGVLKDTQKRDNGPLQTGKDLFIGTGLGGSLYGKYFNGNIREVRLWNKALTELEIKAYLYQSLTGNESNLVGLWRLDNLTKGKLYDKTSNQNNATGNGYTSEMNPEITLQTATKLAGRWDTVPLANTYVIEKNSLFLSNLTTPRFMDSGLKPNTTYTYGITPKNTNGEGVKKTITETTRIDNLILFNTPNIEPFPAVTLNGNKQTISTDLNDRIRLSDYREPGNGYHLQLHATPFTENSGSGYLLPKGSLTLKALSSTFNEYGFQENLIKNGGFEQLNLTTGNASNWQYTGNGEWTRETDEILNGTYSEKLQASDLSSGETIRLSQTIDILAGGKDFTMGANIKTDSLVDASIAIKIDWYDDNGNFLSASISREIEQNTENFDFLELKGIIPETARSGKVTLFITGNENHAGGIVYVDDIQFREENLPSPTATSASWVLDGNQAVSILEAGSEEGKAIHSVLFPKNALTLTLFPESTQINTTLLNGEPTIYQSTLTWSLIAGP